MFIKRMQNLHFFLVLVKLARLCFIRLLHGRLKLPFGIRMTLRLGELMRNMMISGARPDLVWHCNHPRIDRNLKHQG